MSARSNRTDPLTIPPNPSTADLHKGDGRNLRLELRTHQTATVTAVSGDGRTVDVVVGSLAVVMDHFTPATTRTPNPVKTQDPVQLSGIPVAVWETAAGRFTIPIVPGDTGELHVQDRGLGEWRKVGIPVDPRSMFTHMLGDSIFHPTVRKVGGTPVDPLATVVDHDNLVKIGAGAVDFVALSLKVLAELQKIQTWAASHTHVTVVATVPTTSAPALPVLSVPGSVAASKCQAE